MKAFGKLLSLILIVSIISSFALSVNATNIQESDMWVSAGASLYSTETSMLHSPQTACYIRLKYIKFNNYPIGEIPSSYYVYARLYEGSTAASNLASFSQVTPEGSYNYSYLSGHGAQYDTHKLKTNSNLHIGYEGIFQWSSYAYN